MATFLCPNDPLRRIGLGWRGGIKTAAFAAGKNRPKNLKEDSMKGSTETGMLK